MSLCKFQQIINPLKKRISMKRIKNTQQIHIRCDKETREKWLAICEVAERTTQSIVFKNITDDLFKSIESKHKSKNHE